MKTPLSIQKLLLLFLVLTSVNLQARNNRIPYALNNYENHHASLV